MKKPIIGLTSNYLASLHGALNLGVSLDEQPLHLIAEDYISAIQNAGGVPVILPTDSDLERTKTVLDCLDGVLITGGGPDVSPILYKEPISQYCGHWDLNRDYYEIEIIKYMLEANKPILGICHGLQILNVALGGTLYQDLTPDGFYLHKVLNSHRNFAVHSVKINEHTLLNEILGVQEMKVNSIHHQSVKELGSDLEVTAVSPDGVIEAVAMSEKKFVLGIQWHPEMMFDCDLQKSIFRKFVEACC